MTPSAEKPICNVCGFRLLASREVISAREMRSCLACGSTLRFRALMSALQTELDGSGRIRILERMARRGSIRGIGMSDADVYAAALERTFNYINTFFHMQPVLDIRAPAQQHLGRYDFVVSSDVLEHVDGPCVDALRNLRALLKPGGLLALTVPYGFHDTTIEHFPELHEYWTEGEGANRVLVNITQTGVEQRFSDLCFHGGDGSTLELRIYAYADLVRWLADVGFVDIKLHSNEHPQWGIIHQDHLGLPITARAG